MKMTFAGIAARLMALAPKEGDLSDDGLKVRARIDSFSQVCYLFYLVFALAIGGRGLYMSFQENGTLSEGLTIAGVAGACSAYLFFRVWFPFEWRPSPLALWLEKNVPREKHAEAADPGTTTGESAFQSIGGLAGLLGGVVAFIAVYVAAVGAAGWVIGIALGWIPALLAAFVAGLLCRYLWWLALIGIVLLIVMLQ